MSFSLGQPDRNQRIYHELAAPRASASFEKKFQVNAPTLCGAARRRRRMRGFCLIASLHLNLGFSSIFFPPWCFLSFVLSYFLSGFAYSITVQTRNIGMNIDEDWKSQVYPWTKWVLPFIQTFVCFSTLHSISELEWYDQLRQLLAWKLYASCFIVNIHEFLPWRE